MPEGTCIKCGLKYAGWALNQRQHLSCKCGGKIKVWSANECMYGNGKFLYAKTQFEVAPGHNTHI
jgi:hypothetical protein